MDLKDKKILTILDQNARTPLSKIAKKVRLSKQVVDYRIKNMMKKNIITCFTIHCDLTKLGYTTFEVFLRFRNLGEKKEEEVIAHIVNHPFTKWVVESAGEWDLAFTLYARNLLEFESDIEELIGDISDYVEKYQTSTVLSIQDSYLKLLKKKDDFQTKPIRKQFVVDREIEKIDEIDIRIIQELQENARVNLVKIANKLNVSADIIRYRLKNLINKGIIVEFKTEVNFKTLGYNWYKIVLDLKRCSESYEKKILTQIKQIPNLTYLVRCLGEWDYALHIHAKSNEEFRKILLYVREKLGEIIFSFESLIVFTMHKSQTLPYGVAEQLIKDMKQPVKKPRKKA